MSDYLSCNSSSRDIKVLQTVVLKYDSDDVLRCRDKKEESTVQHGPETQAESKLQNAD